MLLLSERECEKLQVKSESPFPIRSEYQGTTFSGEKQILCFLEELTSSLLLGKAYQAPSWPPRPTSRQRNVPNKLNS